MFERVRAMKASSPETIGGVLVFIGLVLFILVFFTVYPALRDPVGTYDKWFPESDEPIVSTNTVVEETEASVEPIAAFRFVAETIMPEVEEGAEIEVPLAIYEVSFEDTSEPGDADISTQEWDFGDGNEARGAIVNHVYRDPGVYPVRLTIADDNGMTSKVEGDVEVPEEGRSFGRVESEESLDLSGIESAVEDAVATLEASIDDTLDSVGSTARSLGVIVLFALAAIATTVVAWRVTRSGVMLLRPAQKMRLRVKSADMHVDIGRAPIEEAMGDRPSEEELLEDELGSEVAEV